MKSRMVFLGLSLFTGGLFSCECGEPSGSDAASPRRDTGGYDQYVGDSAAPDTAGTDAARPDTAGGQDAARPDTAGHDTSGTDTTAPHDARLPDVVQSDMGRCNDACPAIGARQCSGTGWVECGNFDSDECLEWGTEHDCPAQTTCSQGYCQTGCSNECAVSGARVCGANNTFATCGQSDTDACLDLSPYEACPNGTTCSNGFCAVSCQNECDQAGVTQCATGGVITCGNSDADPCLDWSQPVPCANGTSCVNGECRQGGCTDECTTDQRECVGPSSFHTCGQADSDTCLDWSTPVGCPTGERCNTSTGQCEAGCVDQCPANTPTACYTGNSTLACVVNSTSGCREWSVVECPTNQACIGVACAACAADSFESPTRNDDPAAATPIATIASTPWQQTSLTICQPDVDWFVYSATAGQNILVEVTFLQANGDLDLSIFSPDQNLVAVGWGTDDNERAVINNTLAGDYLIAIYGYDYGRPVGDSNSYGLKLSTVACTDECFVEGQRFCTDANARATCVDIDADGCLEAESGAVACPTGTSCADGVCVDCANECTLAETACFRGTQINCVQPTGYSCTFWQIASTCSATQECGPSSADVCSACTADAEEAGASNNTFATATTVGFGTVAGKTICVGDRDVYKVTVPANHTLQASATFNIRYTSYTDDDGLSVQIYDAAQALKIRTLGDTDTPVTASNVTNAPADFFIVVTSAYEGENLPLTSNAYALTLTDLTCVDGCPLVGEMRCAGASQTDVQICADGNADGCSEWGTTVTCDSYFGVAGFSCADSTCVWVCAADTYDTGSNNNLVGSATTMTLGGSAAGLTICEGDIDWFRVNVPAFQSVAVTATLTLGSVVLYNADDQGNVLGVDSTGGTPVSVVLSNNTASAKDMYAVVVGNNDLAKYDLAVGTAQGCNNECAWNGYYDCFDGNTASACVGDVDGDICYEWNRTYDIDCPGGQICQAGYGCVYPCTADANDTVAPGNDSYENATALASGATSNLTLCAGDGDFYVINDVLLNATITVTATIASTLDQGDLDLAVYDIAGTLVDYSVTTRSTEQVTFKARKAGAYYLYVFLNSGNYASYSLTLTRQ